jgi:uncharacterized membrane protein HdeD (DUF308 family)
MFPSVITFIRGMLAVVLGLALVVDPIKVRPLLTNFIGIFWLASGALSLRWGAQGERIHGWAIFAGVVGVLAGLMLIARRLMPIWVPQAAYLSLIGVIALLTGLLHALGGFRTGATFHRKWSLTSFLLGVFEIVLGTLLITDPLGQSRFFYLLMTAWALVGGFLLIGDSLRLRLAAQSHRSGAKS